MTVAPEPAGEGPPPAKRPGVSVGTRASRGMAAMGLQSGVTRVVSSVSQLVLAALLLPEAFGLIAIAYTIRAFASVVQEIGLREVLISRQARLGRWANAAMWFAATMGLLAALLMVLAAPAVAWAVGERTLIGLTLVLALGQPAQSMVMVAQAIVERDLRYKSVAMLEGAAVVCQSALMITFAALGFGAYSFAIAVAIMLWLRFAGYIRLGRSRLRRTPQFHRWPLFFRAMLPMGGSAVLEKTIEQADYAILTGMTKNEAIVGQYFFAFGQSSQMAQLFVVQFVRVLFAGLSHLKDDVVRQVEAFIRAIRVIALLAIPFGVGQAAIARPALTLLFGERWAEAIPLLEILSVMAGLGMTAWPSMSLLMAQERYGTRFRLRLAGVTLYLTIVGLGAFYGATVLFTNFGVALGIAVGVGVFRLLYSPVQLFIACRPARVKFWRVLRLLYTPFVGALVTILPVAWGVRSAIDVVGEWVSPAYFTALAVSPPQEGFGQRWVVEAVGLGGRWPELMALVLTPPLGALGYWLWCRTVQRGDLVSLRQQFDRVLPKRLARFIPSWVW